MSNKEKTEKKDERGDPNTFWDKVEVQQQLQCVDSPGKVNSQVANSVKASKRKLITTAVRRSSRIQDTVVTARYGLQNKEPVIEELTISDSEKEEEQYDIAEKELANPISTLSEENNEDKIDYVIQLLEAQGKNFETLMSKAMKENSSHSDGSEMTYKGLYIDSQKKNEALTKENRELTMKLKIAEAKIEMLKSNPQHLVDLAGKVRDIVMINSVANPAFNAFSSQDAAVQEHNTANKRAKHQKKGKKVKFTPTH
ncbi:hypothetical protein UlMin_031418 [Ulmus minor]